MASSKRLPRLLDEDRSANLTDKRNSRVGISVLDSRKLQALQESAMVVPTSSSLPEKQVEFPRGKTSWVSSHSCGYGGGHGFRFRRLFAAAASSSSRTARQILNDDSKYAESFQLGTIAGDLELSMVLESLSLETDGRYHAGGGGGDVVIGFQPTDHLRHRVHEGLGDGDGDGLLGSVGRGLARRMRRRWTSRRAPFAATSLNLLHGCGKGNVEDREAGMETDRVNGRGSHHGVCHPQEGVLQEGGWGEKNGDVKGDGQDALTGRSWLLAAATSLRLLQGSRSGSVFRSSGKGDMGEREAVRPERTGKESRQERGHLLQEEKKNENGNQDCRMTLGRQTGNQLAMAEDLPEDAGVRHRAKGQRGAEPEKKCKLVNHSQRRDHLVTREEDRHGRHVHEDKPAETKAQESPGMPKSDQSVSPTNPSEMSENRSQMSENRSQMSENGSQLSRKGCDGVSDDEMSLDMRLQRLKMAGERILSEIGNAQLSANDYKTELTEEMNSADMRAKQVVTEVSRHLSEIGKDLRIPVTRIDIPPVGPVRGLEVKQLLCGALAGGASATAVAPLSVLVTRMVVGQAPPPSTPQALGSVLRMQGLRLFSFLTNVLIISVAKGVEFLTYETVRRRILQVPRGKEPRVLPFPRGISLATLPGAAAGLMGTLTVYPAAALGDRMSAEPARYTGLTDAFMKVLKNEGIRHVYSGLTPALLVLVPNAIFNFYTYDTLKRWYIRRHLEVDRISSLNTIWMGSAAGVVSRFLTFPLEVTRKDMTFSLAADPVFKWAPSPQGFSSMWSAMRIIVENEGVKGLYRGVVPAVVLIAPRSAIAWAVYEAAKRAFIAVGEEDRNEFKDASETA
ncbi:hypothetical protein CBR_g19105 [Chara braunii]|uniref:Uncharacterized protein n=1 Tax=Chara braunii TaxID=69332 RepID=A0A388KXA4_CHABU|nr:hypothetical protein CBR_g19105 [Chara braunii]|eukprot:GBG74700.1 hypothetical protein CBR_g19105 [Chara braunii]